MTIAHFLLWVRIGLFLTGGIVLPGSLFASDLPPATLPFSPALPGYAFLFPRDHGNHPQFQTEWWYFTGHLAGPRGQQLGYELTFFRRGIDSALVWDNPSSWAIRNIFFAHFAITDVNGGQFGFAEKLSRAGMGKAGARTNSLDIWIDQWRVHSVDLEHQSLHLSAKSPQFSIDLLVEPQKPPVIHGNDGVSPKGSETGQASHYYSLSRLQTTGSVSLPLESFSVKGTSWMDHEFGSGELEKGLVGWDWFSLQLDNQFEIMAYGLRKNDGSFDSASSGTLVAPDGSSQHLRWEEFAITVQKYWTSPVSGARYPHQWVLSIPEEGIELQLIPRLANQELNTTQSTGVTYWEGAVEVSGKWKGQAIQGKGYVELTGYAKPYALSR